MHVGWVASFDPPEHGPPPTSEELIAHIAARMERRPPLPPEAGRRAARRPRPRVGRRPRVRPARHLHAADQRPRRADRRRALDAAGARRAAVGDVGRRRPADDHRQGAPLHGRRHRGGRARQPDARRRPGRGGPRGRRVGAGARPNPGQRLGRAIADRIGETARLAGGAAAAGHQPAARCPGTARMVGHTLLPPAPQLAAEPPRVRRAATTRASPARSASCARSAARFGVTPNDVVLAACAGALHRFLDEPMRAQGHGPGRRALGRRPGGERQPHLVRVPRAAVPRARPGRAPPGHPPLDRAAPARRGGRAARRRLPRCWPSPPAPSSARSRTPSPTRASST